MKFYNCHYCLTSSTRKYNIKRHIKRKHPGNKIPDNVNSTTKNFIKSSLLSETPSTTFPAWLKYPNYIQNLPLLQHPYFYQNNNVFNLNSLNIHYEPLSNIDFGKPLLFKIYKCPVCFRDSPIMFSTFDSIKTISEHVCYFNFHLFPRANEE